MKMLVTQVKIDNDQAVVQVLAVDNKGRGVGRFSDLRFDGTNDVFRTFGVAAQYLPGRTFTPYFTPSFTPPEEVS